MDLVSVIVFDHTCATQRRHSDATIRVPKRHSTVHQYSHFTPSTSSIGLIHLLVPSRSPQPTRQTADPFPTLFIVCWHVLLIPVWRYD